MSRIPNLARAILALVVFIVLGVLVIVVFGSQVGGPLATPIAKVTPTPTGPTVPTPPPYPPPGSPTPPGPPATPTSAPTPIPLCTFAAIPASAEPGPALDQYVFSEPRLVLTHTAAIEIAGWLPDGERLLITRNFPDTNRQTVETFNTRTGEMRRYAERHSSSSKPAWLAAQQAVAFMDATLAEGRAWWSLRLSYGETQPIETLHTRLASLYLAVDPTGQRVSVLVRDRGERPVIIDMAKKTTRSLPDVPLSMEESYRMVWSPRGKWLACYSIEGFYLIEVTTGQVCAVDLGTYQYGGKRWAMDAQWSPDERYLIMLTTTGRLPVHFTDLTILDTATGELRSVRPETDVTSGQPYVADMAWSPDSQAIVIRSAVERKDGVRYEGLYLVEVVTGQIRRMLPLMMFIGGDAGLSLAWSPNENQLAVNWPTRTEGRLYLITVTTRQ